MSGHSKWSTIKRQKGANDAKRGAMFTKVAREIAVAARAGGGDPDANYRLRLAIDKARSINMPADNIKRAIEKATGGGEDVQYEEIVYEGYGPGGVAVLVEAATDNRNRTAAEVRSIFAKTGGQLAGSGAVAWQFEVRGLITVDRDGNDPDEVALAAIDAGAADVDTETDPIEIYTEPARARGRAQGDRGRGRRRRRRRERDDREADRQPRGRPGPQGACAWSSCSRTWTTSSGSPPTSTSPRTCSPRSPGDRPRDRPRDGRHGLRHRRTDGAEASARSTTAA